VAVLGELASTTCGGQPINHDPCFAAEYDCFANPPCGECLTALYTNSDSVAAAFASPPCVATGMANLGIIAASQCFPFPMCTFGRLQCARDPACSSCFAVLQAGDGAGAAQQCAAEESAGLLDSTVLGCVFGNSLS
jgi:hypothetical protein